MKPPPRTRTKPNRNLKPQQSGRLVCKWQRAEQRKLLNALRRLSRIVGDNGDIDFAFLRKHVPTRSSTEIHFVVESLKNKVISCANLKLKEKRWKEKKVRKPIEVWTQMASVVAGTIEQTISTALSQLLIVTSTEPRTLRNCDPPQVHTQPTEKNRPVGRTVPLRPMPSLPVEGQRPGTNTTRSFQVFKTPAPTMGPVVKVPSSKIPPPRQQISTTVTSHAVTSSSQPAVTTCQLGTAKLFNAPFTSSQPLSQTVTPIAGQVRPNFSSASMVNTQNISSSLSQIAQQPSEQDYTTISATSTPPFSSSTPDLSTTPSSVASSSSAPSSCGSMPQLSSSAAAYHARFGRTSKFATKDSPRMFGVRCVVDFERIYRYLSVINKPNEECRLTPMESAILLDLLMSLPEELSLLDCNKLHKHLIQVYQGLSSPADSKIARELFKDLKDGDNRTDSHQKTAWTSNSTDVTDSEGRKLQPDEAENQSSENSNTFSQSSDKEVTGICPLPPPLNPFMMPIKLIMRKKVSVPNSKKNVQ